MSVGTRRPLALLLAVALPCFAAPSAQQAPRKLLIAGNEYFFMVPDVVPPGVTAISFENQGKLRHELNIVRLKLGVTLDSVLKVPHGPDRLPLLDVNTGGILFAQPGQRTVDQLLVNLESGRIYLLICNLKDPKDEPPHSDRGMVQSFRVR